MPSSFWSEVSLTKIMLLKFWKIWQQQKWEVDYGISMWTDFWLIATNWALGARKRIVVWKWTEDLSFLGYFCLFCSSRLCRAADRHDWPDQGAESQPGHPLFGVQTICHTHVLPQGEKDFCFCDTNPTQYKPHKMTCDRNITSNLDA